MKGIQCHMVTGDNARTAHAIARHLGLSSVFAGVLPDGKVAKVSVVWFCCESGGGMRRMSAVPGSVSLSRGGDGDDGG